MPTNGNQVKFQYIGTTAPASYNADTVYFDNINKGILVGSTPIATYYAGVDVSQYHPNGIVTEINQYKNKVNYYYTYQQFQIPLTYCGTTWAVFSGLFSASSDNSYSIDASGYYGEQPASIIIYVDNSGTVSIKDDIKLAESYQIKIANQPGFAANGTTVNKSSVTDNYGNYATSSTFWTILSNKAANGDDIKIVSSFPDDSIYKFNNYVYMIDSGNFLNFGQQYIYDSGSNSKVLIYYSIIFDMNNETIKQYSKSA